MDYPAFKYVIGFAAQIFFSARTLFQWIKAEKSRHVGSPASYWVFSVAGSWLFCLYGWLRDDFSIILGQFISYYIYLWNLKNKGIWGKLPLVLKIILAATPLVAAAFMLKDAGAFADEFFRNENVPFSLVLFGSAGLIIFTLRFMYQWVYSYRRHESLLPAGFWIISLVGSGLIIAYGVFRHDPVLILGQSFGFVAYLRNLVIGWRERKSSRTTERQK